MKDYKYNNVNITFPGDYKKLKEYLVEEAENRNMTLSALIRLILERWQERDVL